MSRASLPPSGPRPPGGVFPPLFFGVISLGVLLAAFVGPAGHAQNHEAPRFSLAASVDFERVTVRAELRPSFEEREGLAAEVDADGDGSVALDEVREYENDSRMTETDYERLREKKMVLDAVKPTRMDNWTDLVDAVGPIGRVDEWVIEEIRTYHFSRNSNATHVLEGGRYTNREPGVYPGMTGTLNLARQPPNDETEPSSDHAIIRAPEGWIVTQVNRTTYHDQVVEIWHFDTQASYVIRFGPASPEADTETSATPLSGESSTFPVASAGPLALAIIAGLSGATLLRRRRA